MCKHWRTTSIRVSSVPDFDVAIVGGGISGLSAAYELDQRGVDYVLLETSSRFGGVIQTHHVDGFTIDGGPDSLLVQKPAAIELCHELGLGDRLVPTLPPRTAYILRGDRLAPLPHTSVLGIPTRLLPFLRSGLLSPAGIARVAAEVVIPASHSPADESVGAFFRRRFGQQSVDYIAEPLLAGIHAGDVERLSMQSLFPRLVRAEREHGSLIRRFRSQAAASRPVDGMFRSLPNGLGELTAALVARLAPHRLRADHPVARVSAADRPNRFSITTSEATFTASQVLLATPAPVTARLVDTVDPDLSRLCGDIRYTSTATVVLGYRATAVGRSFPGTGFVVPRLERARSLMAGSWVSSKWPGRAPEGSVLFRGFLGGVRDPNAVTRSDDWLVDAAHKDFADLLKLTESPTLRRVFRWPHLNPQHDVGHLGRLESIDRCLERWPGLHLTGAGFHGVGIPDCIANARRLAATIALTGTATHA